MHQAKAEEAAKKLQDLLRDQALRQAEWANAARNSLLNQIGGNAQQYAMNDAMSWSMANMGDRYASQAGGADDVKPHSRTWWDFGNERTRHHT